MKLSQIEKRIPQTLTNSKDVIQNRREYARRCSRARSTRGQENEAWALYKKKKMHPGCSWVDLSRDRYIALPKLATHAGNTFGWGLLFTWDKRDSPVKKLCWMRAWRRRWHLVSPTLYIIIVYRVNLNKLSQNFVEATRTKTTNCRVSFITLDLIFSTNFRIVFLPHTNTVIY